MVNTSVERSESSRESSVGKTVSREEASLHNSAESLWMIYNNKVYDITEFANDHPGGFEWLAKFAGTDITSLLGDADLHEHSPVAYDILRSNYIADIAHSDIWEEAEGKFSSLLYNKKGSPDFIDPAKPLFKQIWNSNFSKEFYLEQVHIPRHLPGPATFFENEYLEIFTRTPWYVIPIFWLPVSAYFYYLGLNIATHSIMLQSFAFGVFLWTLLEYGIHRFVFHFDEMIPEGTLSQVAHFTLHGFHHFLPMDSMRLVMPPALSVFLSIFVYSFMCALFPPGVQHGVIAGLSFTYVLYDEVHYWLHHGQFTVDYIKRLKSYHLEHHYRTYTYGFGITSDFWDKIFGTTFPVNK
ncbi:Ceramide very long chain fatty acid hydroxylase SCS7 [Zancudomyces culisetae]|uniref:Ceramide very long chain fatty acid hydroxylase n=1 Tax=Zancudomyces culisetae TaxID=1213189 RepID=A0A1R1PUR1_ZANCU|nr:Ceramide very long chain fatty acid hydroxylase SCS7 [Zancudomyces culisetae]|eukprot:OMH84653.1 Ceramide very long chain fatty acid hydroxylase SCS7 [Zancudomyces culisetae]